MLLDPKIYDELDATAINVKCRKILFLYLATNIQLKCLCGLKFNN